MLQKLLRIAIRSSSKSPTVSPTPKSLLWTYPLNLKNRLSAQHIPLPFHLAYLAEHFVNHSRISIITALLSLSFITVRITDCKGRIGLLLRRIDAGTHFRVCVIPKGNSGYSLLWRSGLSEPLRPAFFRGSRGKSFLNRNM